jgi:hypothetical protein
MSKEHPAMHVATIRRRHGEREYVSHLVRRSVRVGKRVRHVTVANVSKLPPAALEALRRALAGETLVAAGELFATERSLPHGHVQAVLQTARTRACASARSGPRERRMLAMICQQLLAPGRSSPARARSASRRKPGARAGRVDADELYRALDWLGVRQERIEARHRHLAEGSHVLYDVSSSYFEGRTCPLLALGYSRDGRRGTFADRLASGLRPAGAAGRDRGLPGRPP